MLVDKLKLLKLSQHLRWSLKTLQTGYILPVILVLQEVLSCLFVSHQALRQLQLFARVHTAQIQDNC